MTAVWRGQLVLDPAPAGPFHLTTWPVNLQSAKDRLALLALGREAVERALIRLPVRLADGQTRVELRLPR